MATKCALTYVALTGPDKVINCATPVSKRQSTTHLTLSTFTEPNQPTQFSAKMAHMPNYDSPEPQWPLEVSMALGIPDWTDPDTYAFEDPALYQAQSVPWTDDPKRIQNMAHSLNVLCDKLEVTMKTDFKLKERFESEARKVERSEGFKSGDEALLEQRRILLGWAKMYGDNVPVYQKACIDLTVMLGSQRKARFGYRVGENWGER